MAQRLNAGSSAVKTVYAGSSLVKRVFDGTSGNLLYEHPNFPTLDFTSGALPSTATVPSAGKAQVTYARTGVAYAWQAGSPLPTLVQVAADTPRFSVCPPGVEHSIVGAADGVAVRADADQHPALRPWRGDRLDQHQRHADDIRPGVLCHRHQSHPDRDGRQRVALLHDAAGIADRQLVLLGVGSPRYRHGQGVPNPESRRRNRHQRRTGQFLHRRFEQPAARLGSGLCRHSRRRTVVRRYQHLRSDRFQDRGKRRCDRRRCAAIGSRRLPDQRNSQRLVDAEHPLRRSAAARHQRRRRGNAIPARRRCLGSRCLRRRAAMAHPPGTAHQTHPHRAEQRQLGH